MIDYKNIVFFDSNICITINNYKTSDNVKSLIRQYDNYKTVIFTMIYFLESCFKNKTFSYKDFYEKISQESYNIKNIFKNAVTDIDDIINIYFTKDIFKDFYIDEQIKFHQYLTDILKNTPPQKDIPSVTEKIISKIKEFTLKIYSPISVAALASLYNDNARKLLKLTSNNSMNIVYDMLAIFIISNIGIPLQKMLMNTSQLYFKTNDKPLRKFYQNININALYNLYKHHKSICPVEKEYFNKIPIENWNYLKELFSTP